MRYQIQGRILMKTLVTTLLATVACLYAASSALALEGARNDAGTPTANASVKVGNCTGTLINPVLVLMKLRVCIDSPSNLFGDPPSGVSQSDIHCGHWQSPTRWYNTAQAVPIWFGQDSQNWTYQTQARSASVLACADLILLRLDSPVPASVATPASVITTPSQMPRSLQARFEVAGWGSSGLEDLLTRNIDARLAPPAGWDVIGHAHHVNGMTQSGEFLYAATEQNGLWRRRASGDNAAWQPIGSAPSVVAMAASGGRLFAATSGNRLIVREASSRNRPWTYIGGAYRIVGMTALNGQIYAATALNALWTRAATEGVSGWTAIGHANNITGLAAAGGKIYGTTSNGYLWSREPVLSDVPWVQVARPGGRVRALAASRSQLYAASRAFETRTSGTKNSRRFRQAIGASYANGGCGIRSPETIPGAALCLDLDRAARVRRGDNGSPVYINRADGRRFLVGVVAHNFIEDPENVRFLSTAHASSRDGRLSSGQIGPWLERMAGVGRGR